MNKEQNKCKCICNFCQNGNHDYHSSCFKQTQETKLPEEKEFCSRCKKHFMKCFCDSPQKEEPKEWEEWTIDNNSPTEKEFKQFISKVESKAKQETIAKVREMVEENIMIEQRTHRIGSHSDDWGGDSDLPCDCDEKERKHKIEALESLKNKLKGI